MKARRALPLLLLAAWGCVTTAPPQPKPADVLRGVASWYGQEFAGRTTANGEIFDPMQLTAAHRTLPFGTVCDVKNLETGETVRVRINDRGPFVGNRMIDLSYAAAKQISLIEPGKGNVEVTIVRVGRGEREPPAPFDVAIAEPPQKIAVVPDEPPKVPFPIPAPASAPATVERVDVTEERGGVPSRRQVGADGKTIVSAPAATASALPRESVSAPGSGGFVVQAGAFSVEENARQLQERLSRIGRTSYIDRAGLYRVRLGPFATREEAVRVRDDLEAKGLSAVVMPH